MLLVEKKIFNLNESKIQGDVFIVKGVVQRADAVNKNGRIYPRRILEREVDKYKNTLIKDRMALGELDHPDSSVISYKNVSHNFLDLQWDGNDLIGTVEVLPTPAGNILRKLFEANITVGISSRGLGNVNKIDDETDEVADDFELLGWDFVSNPSTHEAYMYLTEGVKPNNTDKKVDNIIRDIICTLSGHCCLNKK